MRESEFIVDDNGSVWERPFQRIKQALCCELNDSKFTKYAIKNLGFVHMRTTRHGLVISLRPRVTHPMAFAAAVYLLWDFPDERVIVSTLDDSWNYVVCRSHCDAVNRLVTAFTRTATATSFDFLRRLRRIEDVPKDTSFARLLGCWANGTTAFDIDQLSVVFHKILRGRFALVAPQSDGHTLIIEDWGYSFHSYDHRWLAIARGLRFEDQPDYRYGCAAAGAYREVLHSGQPLLEDVDAIVSRPRRGRQRIQYVRLILPIRTLRGETRLLSTSLMDPTIDLRSATRGHEF
jgi:hypothetical protein